MCFQITTKEEVNSKHATSIKTELEPETFRPNLSEPSELLEAQQIEKVVTHNGLIHTRWHIDALTLIVNRLLPKAWS